MAGIVTTTGSILSNSITNDYQTQPKIIFRAYPSVRVITLFQVLKSAAVAGTLWFSGLVPLFMALHDGMLLGHCRWGIV